VVLRLLIEGAIGGAQLSVVAFLLSRFVRDVAGRALLAAVLIVAAVIYVYFAARAGAGAVWLAGELVGIAIYGSMGLRGIRGSAWWLAAGWALHPVWDILLHYIGPGHSFAPETYTIPCITFDLGVAAYIAVAYGLFRLDQRPPLQRRRKAARHEAAV
jgi:hypothetical protein